MSRIIATSNITLYVRTDGNDLNSGLQDTSTGACATIQGAYTKLLTSYDLGGVYTVKIKVANGTYNSGLLAMSNPIGSIFVTIEGDKSNPSNVIIDTPGHCFEAIYGGKLIIEGFRLKSGAMGLCSHISNSVILFNDIVFDNCLYHIYVSRLSYIEAIGNYSIIGNATQHIQASHGGNFRVSNKSINILKNIAFSQFVYGSSLGDITFTGPNNIISNNGFTVLGQRYKVDENAVIQVIGYGQNFFPGNISGVSQSGGLYFC